MLEGLDVSHLSGPIDWPSVKADGKTFAFVRAAYGAKEDDSLLVNVNRARDAGLATGIYHFLRRSLDYQQQIDMMLKLIEDAKIGPGDLPPAVDLEENPDHDGPWKVADTDRYLTAVSKWIDAVQARTGASPMLYTSASFWHTLGNPSMFSSSPLWVANYETATPKLPVGWKSYTFWQYDGHSPVQGITQNVDLDRFNGGMTELEALLLK